MLSMADVLTHVMNNSGTPMIQVRLESLLPGVCSVSGVIPPLLPQTLIRRMMCTKLCFFVCCRTD